MRLLSAREATLALFTFVLGIVTTSVLQAAERNPFQVVDGDGWLTSNADYGTGAWTEPNAARPAFGLELGERNDLPFDRGTAGATFWVRNAGCKPLFGGFGDPCGWQLGLAVTQFRSVVVGGNGMEIDGLGASAPYVRVVNAGDDGMHVAGLLSNAYVDFSGVDSPSAPSWFSGFELDRDTFAVRRAAASSGRFTDLLTLDRDGDAGVSGSVASARSLQDAPNQWATRARLVHGSYTFYYAKPFAAPPVCVATPEGVARVRVIPSTDTCRVTSENPRDTMMVDIVVVGNPS
jgi:hypothetical protein